MLRRDEFKRGFSLALGAVVLLLLLYLGWQTIKAVVAIIMPFAVALVFALLLNPVVNRIERAYLNGRRGPAVGIVFAGFLLLFVGLIAFLVPNLIAQTGRLVSFFAPVTYRVERAPASGGRWRPVAEDIATTTHTVTGLDNGETYQFRVLAKDADDRVYALRPVAARPTASEDSLDSNRVSRASRARGDDAPPRNGAAASPPAPPTPTPLPSVSDFATPLPVPTPGEGEGVPLPSPSATPTEGPDDATPSPSPSPSATPEEGEEPEATPTPSPSPFPSPTATPPPARATPDAEGAAALREPVGTAPYRGEEEDALRLAQDRADGGGVTPTPPSGRVPSPTPTPAARSGGGLALFGGGGAQNPALPANIAPGTVAAYPGDTRVRLVWKPPADVKSGFERLRADVDAWLVSHRRIGPVTLPPDIASLQTQYSAQLSRALQTLSQRVAGIIVGSVGTLLTVILIPILTFYILNDIDRLRARFLMMLPQTARDQFLSTAEDVGGVFGGYLRGMFTVSVLYGLLMTGIFFVSGLKSYALLLGFLAGVLYPVPYIGPLVTTFLAGVVSLATGHSVVQALIIVGVLQGLNLVFDNVLVPRIVGGSVGLHPLTTVFSLLLGAQLFGLWGMLFSVPIAASIQQVMYRLFPSLTAPTPLAMLLPRGRQVRSATETAAHADEAGDRDGVGERPQ